MRLTDQPIWLVRDPGPDSEMCDICWRTTFAGLVDYIRGEKCWSSLHPPRHEPVAPEPLWLDALPRARVVG